ncbi:hypothetical protein V1520DRAFT_372680 [Lipomyces starkeyi]
MDNSQITVKDGKYCQKCAPCRSWTRSDTLRELQMAFTGIDGKPFKICTKCHSNRVGKGQTRPIDFDLDRSYENRELQKRAARLLRYDIFDCTGYYFHRRRVNERQDGPRFNMTCSSSNNRKYETHVSNICRYTGIEMHFALFKTRRTFLNVAVRFISRFQRCMSQPS